ncbi:hypothetical protein G6F57_021727 [Rhizopus arrhizus]|nr:hypothetical protein G6F57_021727 [Rhizopus arrhizus]
MQRLGAHDAAAAGQVGLFRPAGQRRGKRGRRPQGEEETDGGHAPIVGAACALRVVLVAQQHVFEERAEATGRIAQVDLQDPAHLRRRGGQVRQRTGLDRGVREIGHAVARQVEA